MSGAARRAHAAPDAVPRVTVGRRRAAGLGLALDACSGADPLVPVLVRVFALVLVLVLSLVPRPALAGPPALVDDGPPPRVFPAPARLAAGVVRTTPTDATRGLVALTFDDGPSARTTLPILDELARRHVPATFFVNGYRFVGRSPLATRQRELLVEEAARGHDVGNHTYDHPLLSDLAPDRQAKEILDGERDIERVLGERPSLFRPPFGRMTPAAAALLAARGATVVLWNVSSDDPYRRRADLVVDKVMAGLRADGGGVVLLHDTHPWTAAALPRLLDALAAESCQRLRRGEPPFLLVPLDRFTHPRYASRSDQIPAATGTAALAELDGARDRLLRDEVARACDRAASAGREKADRRPSLERTEEAP